MQPTTRACSAGCLIQGPQSAQSSCMPDSLAAALIRHAAARNAKRNAEINFSFFKTATVLFARRDKFAEDIFFFLRGETLRGKRPPFKIIWKRKRGEVPKMATPIEGNVTISSGGKQRGRGHPHQLRDHSKKLRLILQTRGLWIQVRPLHSNCTYS